MTSRTLLDLVNNKISELEKRMCSCRPTEAFHTYCGTMKRLKDDRWLFERALNELLEKKIIHKCEFDAFQDADKCSYFFRRFQKVLLMHTIEVGNLLQADPFGFNKDWRSQLNFQAIQNIQENISLEELELLKIHIING